MAVSQSYVSDTQNVEAVLSVYLSEDRPTVEETAEKVGTTFQNVRHILHCNLDPERYKLEKALRYSRSKMGEKNPMLGKNGSLHPNFLGDVDDGHGYLMRKVDGRYVYVHRLVMAEALGMATLPDEWVVHHINEDKQDNRLDNLALVTNSGHRALHAKKSPYERLPLWAKWESGTSK